MEIIYRDLETKEEFSDYEEFLSFLSYRIIYLSGIPEHMLKRYNRPINKSYFNKISIEGANTTNENETPNMP